MDISWTQCTLQEHIQKSITFSHLWNVNIERTAAALLCLLWLIPFGARAQCADCVADPACTSTDGFPAICPASLPEGATGEWYEETLTFYLPENIVDPGSGVTASLLSVAVTSITGTPLGMEVELDDPDGTYFPSNGQTSGCATICGEPLLTGVYEMLISVSAIASAFGIEQVVNESFSYTLIINPGAGGTSTFAYSAAAGCDSLWVDFAASLTGSESQTSTYAWDLGNGESASSAQVDSVFYATPGTYTVTLNTLISEWILEQLILNSTGGGGWDDFFTPPDPYFVLTDASGTNVYTSSTADDSNSNTWSGLSVVMSNPPYTISFYDEDLLDGDDNLGSTTFNPTSAGAIPLVAGSSNAIANIGVNDLVDITDTLIIQVYSAPEVGVFQTSPTTLSCSNPDLSLYNWLFEGVQVASSGMTPEFVPDATGWYTVEGTTESGCSAWSDSILFCHPDASLPLELLTQNGLPQYLATDDGFALYVWSQNDVSTDTLYGGENALFFPAESSWYRVASIDTLGCPIASDSLLVCWPIDGVEINQTIEGHLTAYGSYTSYQWYQNDLVLNAQNDSILLNPGAGLYAVEVSDFPGCPSFLSAPWTYVHLLETTGLESFVAYPNPFRHTLTIEAPEAGQWWDVSLYDLQGNLILLKQMITTPFQWSLDALPSGIYLMQLQESGRPSDRSFPLVRVIKA